MYFVDLQIDNEDLVFTLETIVEKFEEDMAPYALGLCQHLTQAFWRLQVSFIDGLLQCMSPCLSSE